MILVPVSLVKWYGRVNTCTTRLVDATVSDSWAVLYAGIQRNGRHSRYCQWLRYFQNFRDDHLCLPVAPLPLVVCMGGVNKRAVFFLFVSNNISKGHRSRCPKYLQVRSVVMGSYCLSQSCNQARTTTHCRVLVYTHKPHLSWSHLSINKQTGFSHRHFTFVSHTDIVLAPYYRLHHVFR